MAATTRKAKAKPRTVNEPRDFDFDTFILGIKQPEFTRNLYKRADLVPELSDLEELIEDLEGRLARVEAAEGDTPDRSVTEVNASLQLRTRLQELGEKFNALAEEYQASAEPFTFRSPNQKDDKAAVRAAMEADGVWLDELIEDDTEAAIEYADLTALYSMSLTCTSHPMTVAQWQQLRRVVGEAAFFGLVQAWTEAVKASRPTAPFSPKPLTGHGTTESSTD